MTNKVSRVIFLTSIILLLSLHACKKEGPAEEAGRKLDEQAEHVKQAVQKSIEKVEETMKQQKESMEKSQQSQSNTKPIEQPTK